MWMKINGHLIELTGKQTEMEEALLLQKNRIWRQTFKGSDIILRINFSLAKGGEDTAEIKGIIKIQNGKQVKEFKVEGGCAS